MSSDTLEIRPFAANWDASPTEDVQAHGFLADWSADTAEQTPFAANFAV